MEEPGSCSYLNDTTHERPERKIDGQNSEVADKRYLLHRRWDGIRESQSSKHVFPRQGGDALV